MVIALLGTHLFLTIRLKFPQRKLLKAIRLSVTPDKSAKGDVSQFGALATALADIANALMAIPNIISLIFLSGIIARETKKYLWEDRLDDVE